MALAYFPTTSILHVAYILEHQDRHACHVDIYVKSYLHDHVLSFARALQLIHVQWLTGIQTNQLNFIKNQTSSGSAPN